MSITIGKVEGNVTGVFEQEVIELRELNAELLEALKISKGSILEICGIRGAPLPYSTIRRCDKVIAKAEGKS